MEMEAATAAAAGPEDDEVLHLQPPFVCVYKSGRVERLMGTATVPPGDDPKTGVSSKDVSYLPGLSARLHLPTSAHHGKKKLPVLVYYHGGAFIIESATSPLYTNFHNALCSQAGILAVSVDYRRAPEAPLPAAYDDSWAALQWVLSHSPVGCAAASNRADGDSWLADHGDFGKVILCGDSAGANIVHQMLLRYGANATTEGSAGPTQLFGAILIHPFFWGTTDVGPRSRGTRAGVEKLWRFVCPETSGIDDSRLNPLAETGEIARVGCGRVLVCVAEKDFLNEWGWAYYRELASSGWKGTVEVVETEGEEHVFHLFKPDSDEARAFLHLLSAFISRETASV